ncbi:hypothetical protein IT087_01065 [Candidatus Uhrbacteria bacterium]|nr:hypothetical protein [Candidatus Uhrbacteria bacterium]
MSMLFRRALLTLSFLTVLMPSALALPASAANVMFSCWCQNTTTRTCNHHQIDSGIEQDDPSWDTYGLATLVSPAGAIVLATETTLENLLSDQPELERRLATSDIRQACRDQCAADGSDFRAIHFETHYRESVCSECNPSPDSSCSEARGSRLAFGDADTAQKIAQCEDRKAATALLPVKLAIPIGGVSEVQGLPDYINVAYRYMVTIVLVVAIVMVVYGGFRYLVGATLGDIQTGKKIIQDAIVGMLLVLGAYTILSTINPATTILSFKAPEPIECQDLALPETVKNARCTSDAECGEGTRCVEGRNYVFSISAVAESTVAGYEEGSELAGDFVGSGKVAGLIGLATHPLGLVSLLTETTEERRARGRLATEVVGGVAGSAFARDTETLSQLKQDLNNIRVCSTGEQGAPCLETESCRAPLTCIESWSLCWTDSGNAPGMPCDNDSQCSGGHECIEVENTDFKVCEIEVRDSTPCFRAGEGRTGTVFPAQCNGVDGSGGTFTCAWCPSGEGGTERNWTFLSPGLSQSGQCKPFSVLTTPTPCAAP